MDEVTRRQCLVSAGVLSAGILAHSSLAHASTTDDLWYVDPELRPAARLALAATRDVPVTVQALRKNRAETRKVGNWLPDVSVERKTAPLFRSNGSVSFYVINAQGGTRRGGILHMHGGGFIMGSIETEVVRLQVLAKQLGCTIITVEYRLAPEARWSDSIEDNYAALQWMHREAEAIGVDPQRIVLLGESAGGGHAALLAIVARDRGEVPIAFQCLIYPMLDDRTGSTRPVLDHIGTIVWTPRHNRLGWSSFLGSEAGRSRSAKGGVPARVENLKGLPPTFIGVGGIDLFLLEDVDYARRLMGVGIPTELHVVPGAFHGFDAFGDTPIVSRFKAMKLSALQRALAVPA